MSKFLISFALLTALTTQVLAAVSPAIIPNDRVVFGKTGSTVKTLEANLSKAGASTNPKQQYNPTSGKWEFSNDGTNFKSLGSGSGGGSGLNLLDNADFEAGITSKWTDSASKVTLESVAPLFDSKSFIFTPTASAQYYTSDAYAIPVGLRGANCAASVYYKTAETTNLVKLQAWDGTNVIAEQSLPASANTVMGYVSFVCPSSGTLAVRLASTGSAVAFNGDNAAIGTNNAISNISQAKFLGSVTYASATNCAWTSTSATYANFSADTDCSAPTVIGSVSAPTTKIPGARFENGFGPGTIKAVASGLMTGYSGTNPQCAFRFSDGTNGFSYGRAFGTTGASASPLVGEWTYSTAQGDTTIQMQAAAYAGSSTPTCAIEADTVTYEPFIISFYHFPSVSEQAFKSEAPGVVWTPFTPTGSWSTNTTYTGRYRCDGDELDLDVGISLSGAPTAANLTVNLPSNFTIDTGKFSLGSPSNLNTKVGEALANDATGDPTYAAVHYNSTTSLALFKYNVAGTVSIKDTFNATNPFTFASGDSIHIRASIPVTADSPCSRVRAPVLAGSVTSNSAGPERMERATIAVGANCTSGTCTINQQSGSWLTSVTRAATGQYDLVFAAGIFSAAPTCLALHWNGYCLPNQSPFTSTTASFSCRNTSTNNEAVDTRDILLHCQGPR